MIHGTALLTHLGQPNWRNRAWSVATSAQNNPWTLLRAGSTLTSPLFACLATGRVKEQARALPCCAAAHRAHPRLARWGHPPFAPPLQSPNTAWQPAAQCVSLLPPAHAHGPPRYGQASRKLAPWVAAHTPVAQCVSATPSAGAHGARGVRQAALWSSRWLETVGDAPHLPRAPSRSSSQH